jgi:cyclophilin family peptidyl-prolyl cis-trans isomerase
MTRFVGDAIGVRGGKPKGTSSSQIKKNMETFLETGVHPEVERVQREQREELKIYSLPDADINRAYVFLDITISGKPAGRLVVELFDDLIPVGAGHLRTRCLHGSAGWLQGAHFHKLMRHYGVWGGRSSAAAQGLRLQRNARLQHVEAGAVSVSLSGDEVAISLGRSLPMDLTHQVVGRVTKGLEVLEQISGIALMPDDSPADAIRIAKCGVTNHTGSHDALDDAAAKETKAQTAARLQKESARARNSVLAALEVGMKRKAQGEAGPSGAQQGAAAAAGAAAEGAGAGAAAGAAAAAHKQGAAAGAGRNVKARVLDSMLGGLSDGDESGGSSSDEGGE